MSKWILLAMLGATFACERDRSAEEATEETRGEVGAERDEAARDAKDAAQGAEDEAQDAGQEVEEFGEDVSQGAEEFGRDVKQGAEEVGQDVEEEWEEHTGDAKGPTAQGQSGADNRELVQNVRQKLMDADLSLAAENVQVMAEGGKVTLRGTVTSAEERSQVERLARSASGVTEVDNQIEVGTR